MENKSIHLKRSLFFPALLLFLSLTVTAQEAVNEKPVSSEINSFIKDFSLSGPYNKDNLSVYLVHGKTETDATQDYLTLEEALEKELVIVKETGTVQQLKIINNAENINIFIQAGDIVKGCLLYTSPSPRD